MFKEIKKLNEEFYNWSAVELNDPDNTNPYLIIPDERYRNASFRILVLGKETNGWGDAEKCTSVDALEKLYRDKVLERNFSGCGYPFWDFYFPCILENLKERPDIGVCVSNVALLGKLYGKGHYKAKYAPELSYYLRRYIHALKPDAIICFFGTDGQAGPYLRILKSLWGPYSGDKDTILDPTCENSMRKLFFADSEGIEIYGTRHPQGATNEWKQSIVNSILNDIIPKPQAEAKADGSADEQ